MQRVNKKKDYFWQWRTSVVSFLTLITLLSLSLRVFGQDREINFRSYSTKDGLNQSSILAIHQDQDGFLWIGTYAGLNRYDGYSFETFRHNYINTDAIPDMHIRSICRDTTNILLISTTNGINRFFTQTHEFVNYSHNPDDTTSLSHNTVYKVIKDRDGDIWLGTWGGGLNQMIRKPGKYADEREVQYSFEYHLPSDDPQSISSLFIADMALAPDGALWLATNNGLNRFDKHSGNFTVYRHEPDNPNSISSNDVSSVCIDSNGMVWAGTWEGGLNLLDPESGIIRQFKHDPADPHSLSNNIIMSLYPSPSGDLWIGTWGGGLNMLENGTGDRFVRDILEKKTRPKFSRYQSNASDLKSISGNSIYTIYEDRQGIVWVGTDWAGLNRFELQEEKFKHIYAEKSIENHLVNNIVYSLLLDGKDDLWIGTEEGLNVYDLKKKHFRLYQSNPDNPYSLSHNHIRALEMDGNGNIWIGTEQGLNRYDRKRNRFIRYPQIFTEEEKAIIISLMADREGKIWIGTYEEGLYCYDPDNDTFVRYLHDPSVRSSISHNIIWKILEDRNGNLWIATGGGGLCRFIRKENRFVKYRENDSDTTSIENDIVMTLYEDRNEKLWIGTITGLDKLDLSAGLEDSVFEHYDTDNGLSSPTVIGIVEDKTGKLWLSTTQGLSVFDPEKETAEAFYIEDGLQGNEFSINAIIHDSLSGKVYAGGINGFNYFDPEEVEGVEPPQKTRIVDLRILLRSIEIGEEIDEKVVLPKDIPYLETIELTHRNYVISLEYAALEFKNPYGVEYAYMLDGFDLEWNYVQNERVATYRNLPPGRYNFMVMAANKGSDWNHPTQLSIYIRPPWWNTLLFKIVIAIILITTIISAYLLRVKILKKRQFQLEQMVAQRTQQLSDANVALEEKQEEISLQNEELLAHRHNLEMLVEERTAELKAAKTRA